MTKRLNPGSAHEALVRLFDAIGTKHSFTGAASEGVQIVGDMLDVSRAHLYRLLDPDREGDLSYARVVQITRIFGCTEAAEHLATVAGGIFVPMPAPGASRVAALSAEVMRETGAAIANLLSAASPASEGGAELTPAEAHAAEALVREAMSSLADLYAEVLAAANARPAPGARR